MTTSIRESIIDAVKTALENDTALGIPVYRSRATAIARAEGVCAIVEPARDEVINDDWPISDWSLTLNVTVVARGEEPDSVADPYVTEIHKKIMSDTTVSGHAMDVRAVSSSWEIVDSDGTAAVVTNTFSVRYRTSQTDISSS